MKLPQVIGKNRIRDAQICSLWADGQATEKLGERYKITPRRVRKILYDNKEYLKSEIDWEKAKRIRKIKGWIGDRVSSRDPADLLEQLRKEIEGDKPVIDASQHTHITKVELKISDEVNTPLAQEAGNRLP